MLFGCPVTYEKVKKIFADFNWTLNFVFSIKYFGLVIELNITFLGFYVGT